MFAQKVKDAEAFAQFLENTETFANVECLLNRWIPVEKRYEIA